MSKHLISTIPPLFFVCHFISNVIQIFIQVCDDGVHSHSSASSIFLLNFCQIDTKLWNPMHGINIFQLLSRAGAEEKLESSSKSADLGVGKISRFREMESIPVLPSPWQFTNVLEKCTYIDTIAIQPFR